MKLNETDIGRRVRYHGPSEPGIGYDDHFRVKQLLPHGTTYGNGRFRTVGEWAVCDGGLSGTLMIPHNLLSPVTEDCWCDACDNYAFSS